MKPIMLGPNFPDQPPPYFGGGGIARFRGITPTEPPLPEDWLGSTVTRFGEAEDGLTRLVDGQFLSDVIAADPVEYLGPDHVAAFGANPAVLVKLLDAAERLTVHVHPSDDFARHHLLCDYGKTEAWIVLETDASGGEVWIGFTREVSLAETACWHETAAADEMLACLHRIPVHEGSAVLVPAGVPHAIGPGVLVLELQQPTDFSIGLEPFIPTDDTPASDDLGLGMHIALEAVDREAWSAERVRQLIGPGVRRPGRVLPAAADPFFRAEVISGRDDGGLLEPGFAIVVGVSGVGTLISGGATTAISRGATLLIPYAAGPTSVTGDVTIIACRPGESTIRRPSRPCV